MLRKVTLGQLLELVLTNIEFEHIILTLNYRKVFMKQRCGVAFFLYGQTLLYFILINGNNFR